MAFSMSAAPLAQSKGFSAPSVVAAVLPVAPVVPFVPVAPFVPSFAAPLLETRRAVAVLGVVPGAVGGVGRVIGRGRGPRRGAAVVHARRQRQTRRDDDQDDRNDLAIHIAYLLAPIVLTQEGKIIPENSDLSRGDKSEFQSSSL